ncbi:MAG: hypothetical protein ACW987_20780 [Candidatus Thorarchaeota archaeon]|jgi:hypothetical protein
MQQETVADFEVIEIECSEADVRYYTELDRRIGIVLGDLSFDWDDNHG